MTEPKITELPSGSLILDSRRAGEANIVTFSTADVTKKAGNGGKEQTITFGSDASARIWTWGANNLLPIEREQLVQENNIVPELLATKRDITVGSGLFFFREKYVDGNRVIEEIAEPAEYRAFLEGWAEAVGSTPDAVMRKYLLTSTRNLITHANAFTEFVRDKAGRILSLRALESRHVRPEKQDANGKIPRFFWSGNWKQRSKAEFIPKPIPNYSGEAKKQSKFVYHVLDDAQSDDYLGIPRWWGGRSWIEVANAIPVFHISNLRNGYTIRFHIEIPKDYFYDYSAMRSTDPQKQAALNAEKAARTEFLRTLNDFLAGAENAGRAFITDYEISKQAQKEFSGIKITPINVDLKDKALLDLFERSNEANISGAGVHPTLAAIQTQGKLSSGSEIRNAFLLYVAIKTPVPRQLLLEPLEIVARANNWPKDVKMGFRDIEITKLDEDKSGKKEATPTA